jgi:hypothetical protein
VDKVKDTEDIQHVCVTPDIPNSQYSNLVYYLTHGTAPSHLDFKKKHTLRIKATQYQLINNVLFKKNYDSMLLRCLEKQEADKVLFDLHDEPVGGHFGGDTTAHKILRAGYYWPTLFKYSHAYVRKCKICQTSAGREKKSTLPLQPMIIEQPFEQWGLDIIGEIVLTLPRNCWKIGCCH